MKRAILLLGLVSGLARAGAPLGPAEFERLHRELVPRQPAAWQAVPWKTDLLAARDLAARTGRPLFLWAMNGHPLGCT